MTKPPISVIINLVDFLTRQDFSPMKGQVDAVLADVAEFIKTQLLSFVRHNVWISPVSFDPMISFFFQDAHDACFFELKYGG